MDKYDIIVIGGGPGGYSSAIAAAKEGKKVLLFEGKSVGGTCLNVGCIPTKYLYDKAAAMEKIRELTSQKIFKDCGLYSFEKIQKGRVKVIKKLVGGVDYLLKANGVEVIKKYAELKKAGEVECDGEVYKAKDIIIATGSKPAGIPIPGADYCITSTEALELEKVPKELVVIGGGVIGMEIASAYNSFGSNVTVIEVMPKLYPGEEASVIAYLQKALVKKGIKIYCDTKVQAVEKTSSGYEVSFEGEESGKIPADVVLMATGRKANYQGIDIEGLKLKTTERGIIKVDKYMRTSKAHIYAIGDAAGGYQLAHAAFAEGEAAVANILGEKTPVDVETMPRCIYTNPPFAAVGINSAQAAEKGIDVAVGSFQYVGNGMALAEGADGIVSVIMDKKKKTTLGIQIVGEGAPEMVAAAAFAVKNKTTLKEWSSTVVAHPSLSEMLKEAAMDAFGKSIHGAVK